MTLLNNREDVEWNGEAIFAPEDDDDDPAAAAAEEAEEVVKKGI